MLPIVVVFSSLALTLGAVTVGNLIAEKEWKEWNNE